MGTTLICFIAQCFLVTICIQHAISQPVTPTDNGNDAIVSVSDVQKEDLPDSDDPSPSEIDASDNNTKDLESSDSAPVDPSKSVLSSEQEDKDQNIDTSKPVVLEKDEENNDEPSPSEKDTSDNNETDLKSPDRASVDPSEEEEDKDQNIDTPEPVVLEKDGENDDESNKTPNSLNTDSNSMPNSTLNTSEDEIGIVADSGSGDDCLSNSEAGTPVNIHGTVNIDAHYGPHTTNLGFIDPAIADIGQTFYDTPSNINPNYCDYYSVVYCPKFDNYFNNMWNHCGYCCSDNYMNTPCHFCIPNQYGFTGVGQAYGTVNICRQFF